MYTIINSNNFVNFKIIDDIINLNYEQNDENKNTQIEFDEYLHLTNGPISDTSIKFDIINELLEANEYMKNDNNWSLLVDADSSLIDIISCASYKKEKVQIHPILVNEIGDLAQEYCIDSFSSVPNINSSIKYINKMGLFLNSGNESFLVFKSQFNFNDPLKTIKEWINKVTIKVNHLTVMKDENTNIYLSIQLIFL